jgi:hypothetical protein
LFQIDLGWIQLNLWGTLLVGIAVIAFIKEEIIKRILKKLKKLTGD